MSESNSTLFYAGITLASGLITDFLINRLNRKQIEEDPKPIRSLQLRKRSFVNSKQAPVPEALLNSENPLLDEIKFLNSATCDIERVNHLSLGLDDEFPNIKSPLLGEGNLRSVFGGGGFLPDDAFIYCGSYVINTAVFGPGKRIDQTKKWLRAGPRKSLFFDPKTVKAAIVTCGGLCPGLNVVIRELYMSLHYNYGVQDIYGIKYGYKGFYTYDWIKFDANYVKNIHNLGGTILGSSRGGFDLNKIVEAIVNHGINQVFCLGGDGTHGGVLELFKELRKRKLKISIVGIPKTIDNDIAIIDESFGFETAVEEAINAIKSAYVEANCAENGVGLVRLMGRNAGFIAMSACNASRDAHVCLIPEFKFELYGDRGLLEYCYQRLKKKGTLVLVIAEGAGDAMLDYKVNVLETDASGNKKPQDVGVIVKDELTKYCKNKGMGITLKHIDPTYMIRTVPANPHDKIMCTQLAQNAVHGAMAGFSGFTVGHVNNRLAYIPIEELLSGKYSNRVVADSREWQRLLASTGQPSFLNNEEQMIQQKQQQN
ncbi:unnamed protein product [Paramecium pentaurelia]|uniref:Phosphofructokinase domain-containing protein n=1 Tax=Paramecium pentaurelia TaxID=43138 RepID=A0A8S1RX24_9CILI|nr:unnamed protein product [Paramecium pentaurelia]